MYDDGNMCGSYKPVESTNWKFQLEAEALFLRVCVCVCVLCKDSISLRGHENCPDLGWNVWDGGGVRSTSLLSNSTMPIWATTGILVLKVEKVLFNFLLHPKCDIAASRKKHLQFC